MEFCTKSSAKRGHQLYYNFIKPHESLDGYTPAEFSQIKLDLGRNKWEMLLDKSLNEG